MSSHIFVDETQRRGYLLVASVVVTGELADTRRMLRGLVLPGQRRPHMKDENDSGKRSIATAIAVSGIQGTIYDAGQRRCTERERRAACLRSLVVDIVEGDVAMLVLEQDDTLVVSDRKLLYRATREAGCAELRYEHHRAATDQLLALPDAIVWCWAKGGDWRRRIEPVVADVRTVCTRPDKRAAAGSDRTLVA